MLIRFSTVNLLSLPLLLLKVMIITHNEPLAYEQNYQAYPQNPVYGQPPQVYAHPAVPESHIVYTTPTVIDTAYVLLLMVNFSDAF